MSSLQERRLTRSSRIMRERSGSGDMLFRREDSARFRPATSSATAATGVLAPHYSPCMKKPGERSGWERWRGCGGGNLVLQHSTESPGDRPACKISPEAIDRKSVV